MTTERHEMTKVAIPPEDLKIEVAEDRPKGGMQVGMPPVWVTVTHLPTMISARAYGRSGHKARLAAMTCVELMLEEAKTDKCQFPERVQC